MEVAQTLPLLSRRTLATLARIFELVIDKTVRIGRPSFYDQTLGWQIKDVDSLMYEMDFGAPFIDTCSGRYMWDFNRIIRALEDGTFLAGPTYLPSDPPDPELRLKGEPYLIQLATLCSRMLGDSIFETQTDELAVALFEDGWVYENGALRRLDQEVIDKPVERSRIERLVGASKFDETDVLEGHFLEAVRLTRIGSFHASIGEWRSFYQSLLQQIWRRTKAARAAEFKTYSASPSMSDTLTFLLKAGFFTADEKLAYDSAYGFLCGGSHPGISEEDDAHLAEILCLTLGQALLLKYQRWAARGYKSF